MMFKSYVILVSIVVADAQYGPPIYTATRQTPPASYATTPQYRSAVATKPLIPDSEARYQPDYFYRNHGNLGQVSSYSRNIDTPYSSVRKSDFRVSNSEYNPRYTRTNNPEAYQPPKFNQAETPTPTYTPLPKYAGESTYPAQNPYITPEIKRPGPELLGVAYSAAPAVSHMSFDGYGIKYAY